MKAGLVRIASRSLLALAVVGLSACNDDPLDFNVKTATQLATNPSEMVLNSGGTQRLRVNTLNDGFEPTFDIPSLVEGTDAAACGAPVTGDLSFVELPAATAGGSGITQPIDSVLATGAEPPNKYDVTGVGLGNTCLVASFSSLSEVIPVTVVAFALGLTGPDTIADGDFTTQNYTVTAFDADSAVNASFDVNAAYVTVTSSDTLIANITGLTSPATVEVVRGPLGGTATLTVTTDQNGVIRTTTKDVVVEKPVPAATMITPASGGPGDTVTITGTQLSILSINGTQTIVSVGGNNLANIISESPTQLVVVMPSYSAAAMYPILIDVDGAVSSAGNWDQTTGFSALGCEGGVPDCGAPGNAVISVPFDFTQVMNTTDNFFTFGVSRDMDITFNADWVNAGNDVDILIVDGGFTAFVCTDGATGAKPEQSVCHTEDVGDYIFWMNLYAGVNPVNYTVDAAVSNFR